MQDTNTLIDNLIDEVQNSSKNNKLNNSTFYEGLKHIKSNLNKENNKDNIKFFTDMYNENQIAQEYSKEHFENVLNQLNAFKRKYNNSIKKESGESMEESKKIEKRELNKEQFIKETLINDHISAINVSENLNIVINGHDNPIDSLIGALSGDENYYKEDEIPLEFTENEKKDIIQKIYDGIDDDKKEKFLESLNTFNMSSRIGVAIADIQKKEEQQEIQAETEINESNDLEKTRVITDNTGLNENNVDDNENTKENDKEKEELSFEKDGPAITKYKEDTEKLAKEIEELEKEINEIQEGTLDEDSKNKLNKLEEELKEQEQTLEVYKRRKQNLMDRNNPTNDQNKTYSLEVIRNAEYLINEQTKIVENLNIKYKQTKKELEEKYKENRIKELEEKYKEIEIEQDTYYKQNKGIPVELYGRKKAIIDELNRLKNSANIDLTSKKQELEERKKNIKTYYECLDEIKAINTIDKNSEEYQNRLDKLDEKINTLPIELQEELKNYLKKLKEIPEPPKKSRLKVKAKKALNWMKRHKLICFAIGLALTSTLWLLPPTHMMINSALWNCCNSIKNLFGEEMCQRLGYDNSFLNRLNGINKGLSQIVKGGKYTFEANSGLYTLGGAEGAEALYSAVKANLVSALSLIPAVGGIGFLGSYIKDKIKGENKENKKEPKKEGIVDKVKEKGTNIIGKGKEKINDIKNKFTNDNDTIEEKDNEKEQEDIKNTLSKEQIAEMIKEEVEKQREKDKQIIEQLQKDNQYYKQLIHNLLDSGKIVDDDLAVAINDGLEETNKRTK